VPAVLYVDDNSKPETLIIVWFSVIQKQRTNFWLLLSGDLVGCFKSTISPELKE